MTLLLNPEPDGMGFVYGTFVRGGERFRVDILPPLTEKAHWRHKLRSPGIKPDAKLWTVFLDGEEVGRVAQSTDVSLLLMQHQGGAYPPPGEASCFASSLTVVTFCGGRAEDARWLGSPVLDLTLSVRDKGADHEKTESSARRGFLVGVATDVVHRSG